MTAGDLGEVPYATSNALRTPRPGAYRTREVSDDLWMLGIGYTAANGSIADLGKHLVEK